MEFTGCTRNAAAKAVAEVLNSSAVHIGGFPYDIYEISDRTGRKWKVMRDSSIEPEKKSDGRVVAANDDYKCEFVTPILRYSADMDTLQKIVRAIRAAKGFANSSAGIHVHVGAENHTPATLRNLANIFKSKQDILYRSLGVRDWREVRYCQKLEDEFVNRLNNHKPQTSDSFAEDVYRNHGGLGEMSRHYTSARYYGINFHAYFTKKTVEFRLFNSTLHAGWVRTYVILAIAMNNQAIMQKSASSKVTTSTNECFTFRTWLLRMGFIGELYEVPRKLLLENLQGNKAWRYEVPTAVNS
ncbi:MAG: amidoligase family protein [Ruminococcus sp.]|nr:amidoligase family protein [Ruminococcus sp.]MCM1380744.1 amidoligase family protein [Muribaculaceae bacterium]MCM1478868.1 amidoligase family protein [Muribaculaceae bacterium]